MYPVPEHEEERIELLRSLHIMDSAPAPEFEAVVAMVRDALRVPFAMVSLVDENRQWFKAKCGLDIDGTERSEAFCAYTVMSDEVFTVPDAPKDPRFASLSVVAGPPYIRFYAGAPIVMGPGLAIGTLCANGTEPRTLSAGEATLLTRLAQVVAGLIKGHGQAVDAGELSRQSGIRERQMEEQSRELRLQERRLSQTGRVAGVGRWSLDLRTSEVDWSEEAYRLHGIVPGTPLDLRRVEAQYGRRARVRFRRSIDAAVASGCGFDEAFEVPGPNGLRRLRTVGDVEFAEGVPARLFGIVLEVAGNAPPAEESGPPRDTLTGLADRSRFEELLREACAQPGDTVGMLLVGVDEVGETGVTLGQDAGDALLAGVAQRVRRAVGARGQVARLGGDTFAVLVSAPTDAGELEAVARRILAEMQPGLAWQDHVLKPVVTIGGALRPRGGSAEELGQCADLALRRAETAQRGGYLPFQEALRSAARARSGAVAAVDAALSEGRVEAHYQPVVAARTGRITKFEALARIRDGDEVHSIGSYAEALQDPRTASRLTARMFERIEADVLAWRAAGFANPRIAFNVGELDFRDSMIEELVGRCCGRTGMQPSEFMLEVTESVFLSESTGLVSAVASRLRARGVSVALDDFGTGHASLTHLGSFPVDIVKIDRSFVERLMNGGRGTVITASLIELAHRLGLEVIAEGVETVAQFERLRELNCGKVQGHLFAPALPPAEAARFASGFDMRAALRSQENDRRDETAGPALPMRVPARPRDFSEIRAGI